MAKETTFLCDCGSGHEGNRVVIYPPQRYPEGWTTVTLSARVKAKPSEKPDVQVYRYLAPGCLRLGLEQEEDAMQELADGIIAARKS